MLQLPTKLKKEPLIEVVYELRFNSLGPAGSLLPGLLVSALQSRVASTPKFERLPAAELPQQVRDSDPNLRYVTQLRITYPEFAILVGDRCLAISTSPIYPGWVRFKEIVKFVVSALIAAPYLTNIERYSLKYIDMLEETEAPSDQLINMSLRVGSKQIKNEAFNIRVEIPQGDYICAVTLVNKATVVMSTGSKNGLITDVDVICHSSALLSQYIESLDRSLDEIHAVNKRQFFDCLTDATLKSLEPDYELHAE